MAIVHTIAGEIIPDHIDAAIHLAVADALDDVAQRLGANGKAHHVREALERVSKEHREHGEHMANQVAERNRRDGKLPPVVRRGHNCVQQVTSVLPSHGKPG